MVQRVKWQVLREAAIKAAVMAYKGYSKFAVGVAGLAENGSIFTGCNVENASYGMTLCAECGMISELVKAGCAGTLVAVYVVHVDGDGSVQIITPCGRCRQLIFEHGGHKVRVKWPKGRPKTAKYFLPDAFGPANLEK